jgi:hypothetical protein
MIVIIDDIFIVDIGRSNGDFGFNIADGRFHEKNCFLFFSNENVQFFFILREISKRMFVL